MYVLKINYAHREFSIRTVCSCACACVCAHIFEHEHIKHQRRQRPLMFDTSKVCLIHDCSIDQRFDTSKVLPVARLQQDKLVALFIHECTLYLWYRRVVNYANRPIIHVRVSGVVFILLSWWSAISPHKSPQTLHHARVHTAKRTAMHTGKHTR